MPMELKPRSSAQAAISTAAGYRAPGLAAKSGARISNRIFKVRSAIFFPPGFVPTSSEALVTPRQSSPRLALLFSNRSDLSNGKVMSTLLLSCHTSSRKLDHSRSNQYCDVTCSTLTSNANYANRRHIPSDAKAFILGQIQLRKLR